MSDYSNRDEWNNEKIIGEYVTTRLALNGTWIPSLYDNLINKSKELYAEILRRMDATSSPESINSPEQEWEHLTVGFLKEGNIAAGADNFDSL